MIAQNLSSSNFRVEMLSFLSGSYHIFFMTTLPIRYILIWISLKILTILSAPVFHNILSLVKGFSIDSA